MFQLEQVLNDFYQGLKLLEAYETSNAQGSMKVHFFAINKVIALLDSAATAGNVLAPFFLHYIARKYDGFIDKTLLPDLSRLPEHIESGRNWLRAYEKYLEIHHEIDCFLNSNLVPKEYNITDPSKMKQAMSSIHLHQKMTMKKDKQLKDKILQLSAISCSLTGLLTAKLFQKLEHIDENIIVDCYENSAFHPNLWAMYEYWNYLSRNGKLNHQNFKHQKLLIELKLLQKNKGDIGSLVQHYEEQSNLRYHSQWLFQDALHGGIHASLKLMTLYSSSNVQWRTPISNQNELMEALKWFNWTYSNASQGRMKIIFKEAAILCANYEEFIGDNLNNATLLAYLLYKMNYYLLNNPDSHSDLMSTEIIIALSNFHPILMRLRAVNQGLLPMLLRKIPMINNEMALALQKKGINKEAEYFYRKALALEPNSLIYQYNLANILDIQDKHHDEQRALYFMAAEQGCPDSLNRLYVQCTLENRATLEEMQKLHSLCQDLKVESIMGMNKEAAVLLVRLFIHQKIQPNTEDSVFRLNISGDKESDPIYNADNDEIDSPSAAENESRLIESPVMLVSDSPSDIKEDYEPRQKQVTLPQDCKKERKNSPGKTGQSSTFFQRSAETEPPASTSAETRATKTLVRLNEKPIRTLSYNDLVTAQKAYNILMGQSGHVTVSRKGKTSGSRAKIGSVGVHIPHGKDRTSIGAQHEIKEVIQEYCGELNSNIKPHI